MRVAGGKLSPGTVKIRSFIATTADDDAPPKN
jgi:hypothetical protein